MSTFYSRFRKNLGENSKEIVYFAFDVAKYLALFHITATNVVNFTFCVGPSMKPTINEEGDVVLIDLFSYKILDIEYKVGDVVISECPTDRHKTVCKRVKAVAGDTIVNYKRHMSHYPEVITIPQGHVWLAGDNPSNSTDSRSYGPVSVGLLYGRVFSKVSTKFPIFSAIPDLTPPGGDKPPLNGKVEVMRRETKIAGSKPIEQALSPYEMVMLKRAQRDKDKEESMSSSGNSDNGGNSGSSGSSSNGSSGDPSGAAGSKEKEKEKEATCEGKQ